MALHSYVDALLTMFQTILVPNADVCQELQFGVRYQFPDSSHKVVANTGYLPRAYATTACNMHNPATFVYSRSIIIAQHTFTLMGAGCMCITRAHGPRHMLLSACNVVADWLTDPPVLQPVQQALVQACHC